MINKGNTGISLIKAGSVITLGLVGWCGWLTNWNVGISNQTAAVVQWQQIYGQRIDWIVQRNGGNPNAVTASYKEVTMATSSER